MLDSLVEEVEFQVDLDNYRLYLHLHLDQI